MWSADPLEKMDEKLKTENMQKEHVYVIFRQQSEQSRQAGVENGATLTTFFSDILQNAPLRSQIFEIFFASGGKLALTPLTKILRTPLNTLLIGSTRVSLPGNSVYGVVLSH